MSPSLMIPLSMTLLRVALAPVVIFLAHHSPLPFAFALCLLLAFVSDIFDGVVARRLGVATPPIRRLDSVADTLFYAAAIYAVWVLNPAVLRDHAFPLCVLVALEVARYVTDFAKFRREASYHMWTSKLWGIALFIAFFQVLVLGQGGMSVSVAVYLGIVADIEGLAISLILPRWRNDVPSIFRAVRIRREESAANAIQQLE